MKRDDTLERLLAGLEPAMPPDDLRSRALAAARTAMAREVERVDLWSQLWSSQPLRLAWATTMVALIAGHVMLSVPNRTPKTAPDAPFLVAGIFHEKELADLARLPRIVANQLPRLDSERSGQQSVRPTEPS
jgi:hypothetical protein